MKKQYKRRFIEDDLTARNDLKSKKLFQKLKAILFTVIAFTLSYILNLIFRGILN